MINNFNYNLWLLFSSIIIIIISFFYLLLSRALKSVNQLKVNIARRCQELSHQLLISQNVKRSHTCSHDFFFFFQVHGAQRLRGTVSGLIKLSLEMSLTVSKRDLLNVFAWSPKCWVKNMVCLYVSTYPSIFHQAHKTTPEKAPQLLGMPCLMCVCPAPIYIILTCIYSSVHLSTYLSVFIHLSLYVNAL